MNYKKITFACVLLGLSLYAGVCAATVREMADEAPASKQTIIADKKDKKLLNKKQRAVQITQEKDKIVVSTKPVAKPPAGTCRSASVAAAGEGWQILFFRYSVAG